MTEQRPLMPHIRKSWSTQTGEFVYVVNEIPAGKWGMGVSPQVRYDWRQAQRWCNVQNAKLRASVD